MNTRIYSVPPLLLALTLVAGSTALGDTVEFSQPPAAAQQNTNARPPLSGAVRIGFGQLPTPVLSTIQTYAGASFVSSLEKGTVQGQTVYQAAFRYNGQPVELRVLPDGSVVKDPADEAFVGQYDRELGLPPTAGLGTAPAGESHGASGSSEGTPANSPSLC
jgi:hypothetical protein